MKKTLCLSIAIIVFSVYLNSTISAQGGVAINNAGSPPDNSALLDMSSNNKGLLVPRMTTAERNTIANPAAGLVIYNTDCSVFNFNAGTPASPNWATLNSSNVLAAGVTIAASPVGAICAGTSVTFTATPSQNNLSPTYQWQVNGVNVGTNSTSYTSSILNNGDVVTCILSSNAPCVTNSPATSNSITMTVNTVPGITGTTPAGFCSGNAVTLSASANIGTINWYSDSTGGSSLSSGASFTVSGLTSTTTYYVDATANGCTTTSRVAVTATFYPSSPNQPGAITGPTAVNIDSVTAYSISALSNTATYAWTVSLGIITSGQGTTSINVAWNDTTGTGGVFVTANNPCGTSAAQTLAVSLETQTFSYTGTGQTFMVPVGVTSVTIAAYGSQGGSQGNNNGALGGSATGTIAVTPGQALYVFVGGQNGYNGGGVGSDGASGGGMSDVRIGGTAFANWVIVAGGGGGGGNNGGSEFNETTGTGGGGAQCVNGAGGGGGGYYTEGSASAGGAGTCTDGGGSGNSSDGWAGGAGGGGLTSGGSGGVSGGYGATAQDGSQGQGGNYSPSTCDCGGCAGGGGGGYFGGGGASAGCCAGGSGGGGSSWASASMTNTNFSGGVQSGNGQVIITW